MKMRGLNMATMLVAGLSVFLMASPQADARALTAKAMRGLSAKAADLKARQDLLSILQPAGKFQYTNRGAFVRMDMHTVAHDVGIERLCARDDLSVTYANTKSKDRKGESMVRPIGVSVRGRYHVLEGAASELREVAAQDRQTWDDACRKFRSDQSAEWFAAEDTIEAAKIANMVLAAAAAIRSGALQPKDCTIAADAKACADKILASAAGLNIAFVDKDCQSGAGQECYAVELGHWAGDVIRLTVAASFDEFSIRPKEIIYVSADAPLIRLD